MLCLGLGDIRRVCVGHSPRSTKEGGNILESGRRDTITIAVSPFLRVATGWVGDHSLHRTTRHDGDIRLVDGRSQIDIGLIDGYMLILPYCIVPVANLVG